MLVSKSFSLLNAGLLEWHYCSSQWLEQIDNIINASHCTELTRQLHASAMLRKSNTN